MKTNAARLLDQLHIAYEVLTYPVDPTDLAATSIALKVGLPAAQVFKTLVVRGDRQGICLAVIPADCELDLKALAQATGDRKVAPVALKEVQPLTGYIRGGVTALAGKKAYPVYVHTTALTFDRIAVSAGQRGRMLYLAPSDYVQAVRGTVAAIGRLVAAD